ncbi:carbohydrate ABC transporter permease [Microbacterium karelineae]|uniref:carbohydrate ABC transporter permease n=1 Tax=Microbacterium karelineae TaxID=2654283 RepID=UPI0018D2F181|nr:sugar ABC transporter permease [Microbacterium karelineae]
MTTTQDVRAGDGAGRASGAARSPRGSRVRWRQLMAFKGASLTFPFLAGFTLFVIVPVAMGLGESVFAMRSAGLGFGEATVEFVGLEHFISGFQDPVFWGGMLRVFLYACVMVPLTQVLSLIAALLLDAARRRVAARFRILLLLPYMVPGIVATLIWIYLYSPVVGPITGTLALVGIEPNFYSAELVWVSIGNLALWSALGFNMLILYGGLQSVPHEIFEAARLDGASELRLAVSIKVPFVRGPLVLTSLLSIIGTLQLFDQPLFFRSVTPETITKDFTPAMMIYNQAFQVGNLNYATALSIILALVVGIASALIYHATNKEEKE